MIPGLYQENRFHSARLHPWCPSPSTSLSVIQQRWARDPPSPLGSDSALLSDLSAHLTALLTPTTVVRTNHFINTLFRALLCWASTEVLCLLWSTSGSQGLLHCCQGTCAATTDALDECTKATHTPLILKLSPARKTKSVLGLKEAKNSRTCS